MEMLNLIFLCTLILKACDFVYFHFFEPVLCYYTTVLCLTVLLAILLFGYYSTICCTICPTIWLFAVSKNLDYFPCQRVNKKIAAFKTVSKR